LGKLLFKIFTDHKGPRLSDGLRRNE